jgi:hypothetical protein
LSYGSISSSKPTNPCRADKIKIWSGFKLRAYFKFFLKSGLTYKSSALDLKASFLLTQEIRTIFAITKQRIEYNKITAIIP